MSPRQFVLALLCIAMVGLGVAWVAGWQSMRAGAAPPASLDAVRLGPDPGQPVAGYLSGLPARLPPASGAPVPALVQFAGELTPEQTVGVLAAAPARAVQVVFRVPLPRVQTALWFERLPEVDLADPLAANSRRIALAQQAAHRDAQARARGVEGRQGQVSRYEAEALGGPAPCVLAVVVSGDRAALTRLAAQPGVRAVDAAPEGTPVTGLALSPLLPEQTDTATPTPDDGPVPAGTVPAGAGSTGAGSTGAGSTGAGSTGAGVSPSGPG